jgi:hypothetical protein
MWCSDPFLTSLKSFGYSVVRLPKANIRPLQVLVKQNKEFDRLGQIDTLFVQGASAPIPVVTLDQQAANISGQRTGEVSVGVGLSILGSVIGAMGGSTLGLDVQYKSAKRVVFEFTEVLEDRLEVLKLDQYLADADVNPLSRHASELLEADELYVTTATLKTRKLIVEGRESRGTAAELKVPVIQQLVGGTVKVSADAEAASKLTYEGAVPLIFGFQAVQLFFEEGRYTAFKPIEPGAGMRSLERAPSDGATRLIAESPLVRLGGD